MAAQCAAYKMEVCLASGVRCTEERKPMQLHQPGAPELSYMTPKNLQMARAEQGV